MASSAYNVAFIAWSDIRHQMRQAATLVWVFVMPPIFFYFIGTVTGGFSSAVGPGQTRPLVVEAAAPGFLADQIDLRLRDNGFEPEWTETIGEAADQQDGDGDQGPTRSLRFGPQLTDGILGGEKVIADYATRASPLARQYENLQVQRSIYTFLADVAAAQATSPNGLSQESLDALNRAPRAWQLDVASAGARKSVPTGFEQSIPGMMVMFTLLVLLTSGASLLANERNQGLLRRLASAPIARSEVVAGKWLARMALAAVQVGAALAIGTWLFRMDWGGSLPMVLVVLAGWAAFCASAGLLLGSIARTDAQASGIGVLVANVLAALGGCWWPIEITPDWMQFVQKLLPTGWAMDALHRLVSFGADATSALPHLGALLAGSLLVGVAAVRAFRYE